MFVGPRRRKMHLDGAPLAHLGETMYQALGIAGCWLPAPKMFEFDVGSWCHFKSVTVPFATLWWAHNVNFEAEAGGRGWSRLPYDHNQR